MAIHRNNTSVAYTTGRSAGKEKASRRTSGNQGITTLHSQETFEKDNPSNAPAIGSHSTKQAVPPNSTKILDSNTDKNNDDSDSKLSQLSKEDAISGTQLEVTKGDPVFRQMQRANGSTLYGLLRKIEPVMAWLQMYSLC